MKAIEIERNKKILKRAKKILNCIGEAKRRIDGAETAIRQLHSDFSGVIRWHRKNIESHKAAIVKLEKYYHKTVNQL